MPIMFDFYIYICNINFKMINDMSKDAILGDNFCMVLDCKDLSLYPAKYINVTPVPVCLYDFSKKDVFAVYCSYYKSLHGYYPWNSKLYNDSKDIFYNSCTRYGFVVLLLEEILKTFDLFDNYRGFVSKIYIYSNTLNPVTSTNFKFLIQFDD